MFTTITVNRYSVLEHDYPAIRTADKRSIGISGAETITYNGLTHFNLDKTNGQYINFDAFTDLLYDRIIIEPQTINCGFITADRSYSVEIWNLYSTAIDITDNTTNINANDGIYIDAAYPQTIQPYCNVQFNIDIYKQGAAQFTRYITFNTTADDDPTIYLNGLRIMVLTKEPDWNTLQQVYFVYKSLKMYTNDNTEYVKCIDAKKPLITYKYTVLYDENDFVELGYSRAIVPLFAARCTIENISDNIITLSEKLLDVLYDVGYYVYMYNRTTGDFTLTKVTAIDFTANTITIADTINDTYDYITPTLVANVTLEKTQATNKVGAYTISTIGALMC